MSPLLASDPVLLPSYCLGFRMFSRVPRVFKGWNVVRVPPRAQCFPLVRGDLALTCVQSLWSRRSDGWFAGFGLAAAVAYSGVWGGGFKTLASGPSVCCGLGFAVPRSGSVGLVGGGQHQFMVRGSGRDMTSLMLIRKFLGKLLPLRHGSFGALGLSCQRGRGQCPHIYLLFKAVEPDPQRQLLAPMKNRPWAAMIAH